MARGLVRSLPAQAKSAKRTDYCPIKVQGFLHTFNKVVTHAPAIYTKQKVYPGQNLVLLFGGNLGHLHYKSHSFAKKGQVQDIWK